MRHTDNIPAASTRSSTWRGALDVVATLAILVAAGMVIWSTTRGGGSTAPTRAAIAVPKEPVALDGVPMLGVPEARVVVVEFSDFECPYCGRFAKEVFPALKAKYVDSGQVQFGFRHLPLVQIHARAQAAAEAAECAARQDRFWPMHDALFADPKTLADANITSYAAVVGLDTTAFNACRGGEAAARVQKDTELAQALGISGTPAFLIGKKQADGRLLVDRIISGAQPLGAFAQALDALLAD